MTCKGRRREGERNTSEIGSCPCSDDATIYGRLLAEKCAIQMLSDTKEPAAHTSFLHEHTFSLSLNILALRER